MTQVREDTRPGWDKVQAHVLSREEPDGQLLAGCVVQPHVLAVDHRLAAEAAPHPARRVLDHGALAAACSGTSISRLRILPVGPLGSSSSNQILRGYL